MLGLMQIESEAYQDALTPTSPAYLEGVERGPIDANKVVRLDPLYVASLKAVTSTTPVISADVSCVFDAGLTLNAGIPALALRAFVKDGEIYLSLRDNREIAARAFLKALPQKPESLLLVATAAGDLSEETLLALRQQFPECRFLTGTGTPEEAAIAAGYTLLPYPSPFDYCEE